MDLRVANGRYKLIKKIGSGAFGEILMGIDVKTELYVILINI